MSWVDQCKSAFYFEAKIDFRNKRPRETLRSLIGALSRESGIPQKKER